MGLRAYLRGDNIDLGIDQQQAEDRALTRENVPTSWLPFSRQGVLTDITRVNALRVADAYACVRVLSDAVASLPPEIYRQTSDGRVPVGLDQRFAALLRQPTPGSTSADLFSMIMVYLLTYGNSYVGKFRSPDGEVAMLSCLHPDRVMPEARGSTVSYRIDGDDSYGPRDLVHIRALPDPVYGGLLGLSPVAQCRTALSISASLAESAKQYHENGGVPTGVVNIEGASEAALKGYREEWRNRQGLDAGKMHATAFVNGDAKYTPISFSNEDAQFLESREFSTREICRIFGVPPAMVGSDTGGSLTYANVTQQNLQFVSHSLRPWLVRIERAFTNDPELLPGGAYLEFSLDNLLRGDPAMRADFYTLALGDNTHPGWMTRAEVRELENLEPEPAPAPTATPAPQPAPVPTPAPAPSIPTPTGATA